MRVIYNIRGLCRGSCIAGGGVGAVWSRYIKIMLKCFLCKTIKDVAVV